MKYNAHAFYCTNPLNIEYIDKEARCKNRTDPAPNHKQIHWDLLFHPSKAQYSGYKCSIVESTITSRCGILSYTQLLDETVEIPKHISKETCAQMVQERMYRADSGKTIKLDMHKENIIRQLLKVTCTPQLTTLIIAREQIKLFMDQKWIIRSSSIS